MGEEIPLKECMSPNASNAVVKQLHPFAVNDKLYTEINNSSQHKTPISNNNNNNDDIQYDKNTIEKPFITRQHNDSAKEENNSPPIVPRRSKFASNRINLNNNGYLRGRDLNAMSVVSLYESDYHEDYNKEMGTDK